MSEFEIAIGGFTSIPVLGGLIFLGYKSFGEISLDTLKLKPTKRPAGTKETPTTDKKISKVNNQKLEKRSIKLPLAKKKTSAGEQQKPEKEETSTSSKNQSKEIFRAFSRQYK